MLQKKYITEKNCVYYYYIHNYKPTIHTNQVSSFNSFRTLLEYQIYIVFFAFCNNPRNACLFAVSFYDRVK